MANILQKAWQSIALVKPANIDITKNLGGIIQPLQVPRRRQDVIGWRDSITDAEAPYYPRRNKQQHLYIDTILNGHVASCMERRKDLTLLRKFEILDANGKPDDKAVSSFCDVIPKGTDKILTPKLWLNDFISYSLDAIFFGYTLVALGDIANDEFVKPISIKRWNVSPDRHIVATLEYNFTGFDFTAPEFADWHVYVDTPNDIGSSPCGYGLLLKVGLYEIFLRNLLGYNGDFVEMYSQPYRVGKTMKTSKTERDTFEEALRSMGSAGYSIIDPMDEIIFLESKNSGTAYKGYDNLELRCEKKISKLILGHADAMDSIPGKLGAAIGIDSPTTIAMTDKQSKDGVFIENVINRQLIPRMIKLGFNIPEGTTFSFQNDTEQQEIRNKEDDSNLKTATIAQTMKLAGLQMDAKYFADRTGIIATTVPEPVAQVPPPPKITEKLKNLYK
jgi:hypothetical protein